MRTRRLFAAIAISTAGCLGGALALGTSANAVIASSPLQLLNASIAAAEAEKSAHESSHDVQADGSTVDFETDAGVSKGVQLISYTKSHVTGHLTDVVLRGTAFFRGDSFSLTNFFGFPALTAGHLAGHWVSAAKTNSAYLAIAADVTLVSAVDDLQLPGIISSNSSTMKLTKPTVIDGQAVIGIAATTSVAGVTTSATLYVRTKGLPLPVEESVHVTKGTQHSSTMARFSDWNESVNVPNPSHAIWISTIQTS